jgi:hypothetical protein
MVSTDKLITGGNTKKMSISIGIDEAGKSGKIGKILFLFNRAFLLSKGKDHARYRNTEKFTAIRQFGSNRPDSPKTMDSKRITTNPNRTRTKEL